MTYTELVHEAIIKYLHHHAERYLIRSKVGNKDWILPSKVNSIAEVIEDYGVCCCDGGSYICLQISVTINNKVRWVDIDEMTVYKILQEVESYDD